MRLPTRAACAVAMLTVTAGAARAQTVPGSRVLVLPFAAEADPAAPSAAGSARWLGEAAAVLLTNRLADLGAGALARDERVAAFDRLRLPMASTLTRATMIRVGELLGASEIVFGEIHLAQTLSVRVRIVQLGPGRQLPDINDTGSLEGIFAVFDRVGGKVAAAIGRVTATPPSSASRLSLDAFEAYIKGLVAQTPAAERRFLETAMSLAPRNPQILLALWRCYTEQDEHDQALAVANAVPADSTSARQARYAVALSLIALRRFDGASKELLALAKLRSTPAIANALGIVQLRRGVLTGADSAVTHFSRATEGQPDDTDYLFNLGYAHALAHDVPAGLQWLRETVRYDAANGDAHLVMSSLLAGSGRQVEAQRELDLAKLLGTTVDTAAATAPAAAVTPGLERLRQGLELEAVARVDAAIANPAQRDQQQVAKYHLDRGRRLFDQGQDREATSELRRAAYLAPYEDEPHLLLGRLYQRTGRLPEAIDEFTVALWCREGAEGRLALATALFEFGDRDRARREAERALALQPSNAAAKELLKKIGGAG